MFDKVAKIVFIVLFIAMLIVPLATTNMKSDTVSSAERRKLANMPKVWNEDGTKNSEFRSEFEAWINDNIGLRSLLVITNAKLQYHLFGVLAYDYDFLGPHGELNYATEKMLIDYQHRNLKTDEELNRIAEGFQFANDYLKDKGIQLYYFQCWDKHSIYPEYFPTTVLQYGDESMTDGVIKTLQEKTDVVVISPKQALIAAKDRHQPYSKWSDAGHWTQRGAYIGYQLLMNTINEYNDNAYKVLKEDDYNITWTDQGYTLFGGIHFVDMLENFAIIDSHLTLTNEKLTIYLEERNQKFYTNTAVDNTTRVLVFGDSYFGSYLIDDIAQSFYETILIWSDYGNEFEAIVSAYEPDIVIIENAERVDRYSKFADGFLRMKENAEGN